MLAKWFRDDYVYEHVMHTRAEKQLSTRTLMGLPRDGRKRELLGGELLVSPTGFHHGYISSRLLTALLEFALKHRLGVVVDSSTGFRLANGDCLSPDVSFVAKARLKKGITRQFFQGAPDLAIEVLSPGESRSALSRKLASYFKNGARIAWVVNPKDRSVKVYHSAKRSRCLRAADCLEGEALLPGFSLPIASVFELPTLDHKSGAVLEWFFWAFRTSSVYLFTGKQLPPQLHGLDLINRIG